MKKEIFNLKQFNPKEALDNLTLEMWQIGEFKKKFIWQDPPHFLSFWDEDKFVLLNIMELTHSHPVLQLLLF